MYRWLRAVFTSCVDVSVVHVDPLKAVQSSCVSTWHRLFLSVASFPVFVEAAVLQPRTLLSIAAFSHRRRTPEKLMYLVRAYDFAFFTQSRLDLRTSLDVAAIWEHAMNESQISSTRARYLRHMNAHIRMSERV